MTEEDLQQIRTILREEIAAAEQRIQARQDRAVEALTTNQSEATNELRREIGTLRERLDNLAPVMVSRRPHGRLHPVR